MIRFDFLNKNEFFGFSHYLFDILADNMSLICPTGNDREEDFKEWYQAVSEGLKKDKRRIILIFDDTVPKLVGFFQYYTTVDTLMMEEIQFRSEYQSRYNIFRQLYGYVLQNVGSDIRYVEAYANSCNHKSIGILGKLGLELINELRGGKLYHFKGDFSSLVDWYNNPKI